MGRALQYPELLLTPDDHRRLINFIRDKRMAGEPPLPHGPLKGVTLNNRAQVSAHWAAFGWDASTGVPLPETTARLGIDRLTEVKAE